MTSAALAGRLLTLKVSSSAIASQVKITVESSVVLIDTGCAVISGSKTTKLLVS